MTITVEQKVFLNAIKSVKSATAKAELQPVLKCINLKTENGGLVLTTTDCTDIARCIIEANYPIEDNTFNVCINAEKLDAIVSRLDNTITLELKENEGIVVVKSGKIVFKCLYIQGNEFPNVNIELDGDKKILLTKDDFLNGVAKTSFAPLQNNQNSIIAGICLTFGDNSYEMVATDGNRLSQVIFNNTAFQGDGQYVIPRNALLSVAKIIKEDLQIFCKNDSITFYTNNFVYVTRLLNGKYPQYNQLIPNTFEHTISIDKNELLKSLDTISIMANERTNIIKMIFANNNLELVSKSDDGEAKDSIEIDYDNDNENEVVIAFNYHYLIEGLKAMNSEVITININNNTSAVLLIGDYNYLVMPIQIKE